MKFKIILLSVFLSFSVISYSQTEIITKLPAAKTVMFELNFNPMGANGVFSFETMQGKYWLNNTTVLRLGIGYNTKSNGMADGDYDPTVQFKSNINEKSSLFTFKPGIEIRLLKDSKISPYVGLEMIYKNRSSNADYKEYTEIYDYNTQKYKYDFVETKIDGAWRSYTTSNYTGNNGSYTVTNIVYNGERAFSTFGTNLLLGSDFYFVKNMYVGFEVGLGYQSTLYHKIAVDISTNVEKTTIPSYTISNLDFYYNNSIRLGVWF